MNDWPLVPMATVASSSPNAMATGPFGSSVGSKTFRSFGVPLIRGSNLSTDVGKKLIEEDFVFVDDTLADKFQRSQVGRGDLIFTCWGTVNQVGLVEESSRYSKYLVSNKQMKFTADRKKVEPLFLYYWFSSPLGQAEIHSGSIGSSVPGFNLGQLKRIRIPLPPLDMQRAIISVLTALDDKINVNRRMNATLDAIAQAIFKDWFVDFGPTRAKMERHVAYLAPDIWQLFPERLDESEKPEGWLLGRLDDLLLLQRGFDLPGSARTPGDIVVMAASGPNGFHNVAMVKGPGVTTGRSGVLGRVFLVMEDFWPLNTSLWVKEFRLSCPIHAYFLLQKLDFDSFNAGSAVPTLNRNHVHGVPMLLPSKELIDCFEDHCMPLVRRIRSNEIQSDSLAAMRDFLLPKLMVGEIRVRDAEKLSQAAA